MNRRLPEPSRSQWAILAALAETGRMTLKGGRFVAREFAPRSFAFIHVMQVVQRGFARALDANLSAVEPTPLCHRVLAARAARLAAPAPAQSPAMPQSQEAQP